MYTLKGYFERIHHRIDAAIDDERFHPSQRMLLKKTVGLHRNQSLVNPLGEPLTILYLITRAWGRRSDEQVIKVGTFCTLYLLAADLVDDVQDDDLIGKPHESVGPAIAVNNGITLLMLAFSELRSAMEDEKDEARRMAFMKMFNRLSIEAVAGQHRDLSGEACVNSPIEVLDMQREKTSSLSLITESAALLARCDVSVQSLYRDVGEKLAMLVQVRDDIRDIFGKRVSPDLLTGKLTYPMACFYETASEDQLAAFRRYLTEPSRHIKQIRELLYHSGVVAQSAAALEDFRVAIHVDIAETGNAGAYHRTLLDLVDGLAESIYVPPPVKETMASFAPPGLWHDLVRHTLDDFCRNMAPFDPPIPPTLKPWHLPQWLYDAERKTIFYPDVEGLKEEVLPFQAGLLGIDDLDRVETIMFAQVPWVLAHEMFHYWRDASNRITTDHWHEEWAANQLAVAYALRFHPDTVAQSAKLAKSVVERHSKVMDEETEQLLDGCRRYREGKSGYDMDISQLAVTSMEMVSRIIDDRPMLSESISNFLE